MSKEYTYDIDKYTIGVDENGEDGIGLTVAIIKDEGINFLGNCYGENARCIDLLIKENEELKKHLNELQKPQIFIDTQDIEERYGEELYQDYLKEKVEELKKQIEGYRTTNEHLLDKKQFLKQENEKLKKQLEKKYSKVGTLTNEVLYEENTKLINQQQEFIKWLYSMKKIYEEEYKDIDVAEHYNCVLQKYEEIIGKDINVLSKEVSDEKEN